jgi:FkbM family methyltransferase
MKMGSDDQAESERTVFSRSLGRSDTFKSIYLSVLDRVLSKISQKHIVNNRKQLAVFSFDLVAQHINLSGVYEVEELDTFFQWIKPISPKIFEGLALDIGANIGNHSLYFSELFEKVYSFEPNKRTFKVLSLNAELANNVTCFNFGISNVEASAALSFEKGNIGGARIMETGSTTSQTIQLKTLDSVISEHEKINLIKIDIEGHEHSALLGAREVIMRNHPIILFEQHRSDFENGKSEVINLIRKYGYSKFFTIEKHPRSVSWMNTYFRWPYLTFISLFSGPKMKVILKTEIEPDFYTFIVALPDEIKINNLSS